MNSIGSLFRYTTFGESHGTALGVVLDGMPPGIFIDLDFIQSELDRRRPGGNTLGTKRDEKDKISLLSGVFEGVSTGTPLSFVVYNENQKEGDYESIKDLFRPGHGDYTYQCKYGIRDYRGGGRSSARETLSRVIAGSCAKLALRKYNTNINAGVVSVGKVHSENYDWKPPFSSPLYEVKKQDKDRMLSEIENARKNKDSVGGIIECRVSGVAEGLGEPVFDKLSSLLAHSLFSIPAVKGVEIGDGFLSSTHLGSENNDEIYIDNGKVKRRSNHAGGIEGGISNGEEIVLRVAFKPTPSISKEQNTINTKGEEEKIEIKGRHDPCIVPRAVVVVESAVSSVILDALLMQKRFM